MWHKRHLKPRYHHYTIAPYADHNIFALTVARKIKVQAATGNLYWISWPVLMLCSCLYNMSSKRSWYWYSNGCRYASTCSLIFILLRCAVIPYAMRFQCIALSWPCVCLPQGKDDITGEPLIQHDDDKPEALMARLRHYKDVAKPVIDLYKSVNASLSWGSRRSRHTVNMWTSDLNFIDIDNPSE